MRYISMIFFALCFIATNFAMESPHQPLSPLAQRLALCAKTNSDYLRDQIDRIPSSPRSLKRHCHMQGIINQKLKPGPQQPFLELPRKKQEQLLEEYQESYFDTQSNKKR